MVMVSVVWLAVLPEPAVAVRVTTVPGSNRAVQTLVVPPRDPQEMPAGELVTLPCP